MNVGLLWFDDSKRPIEVRAIGAAGAYLAKHNRWPTLCQVHQDHRPAVVNLDPKTSMRIVPSQYILVDHFWIGENGEDNSRGKP